MKTQSAPALNIFIRDRYSEFLNKRPIGHFAHMETSRPKSKVSDSPPNLSINLEDTVIYNHARFSLHHSNNVQKLIVFRKGARF